LKHTGPGKITIDTRYSAPGMLKALLYNFDVDGDTVKQEHQLFLISKVASLLEGDLGHVWMQGSASRSGSGSHNLVLSDRRVHNIAAILRSKGILDRQMQLNAIGAQEAKNHIVEDESDRAVALVVIPVHKESPPPPQVVPSPPPVSTNFKIRLLAGITGGAGAFQVENCFFQIADKKNNVTSFYVYSSMGVGKGLFPMSATMKGPWNDFVTNSAIRVSQFEGAARFTTGGLGHSTANYLNMM
jgi:hypothetical protein